MSINRMTLNRINAEIKNLKENPVTNCSAGPIEDDLTKWQATIFGPEGTPYENGVFTLMIEFTSEFPFKPPKFGLKLQFIIVTLIREEVFVWIF